jgi:8-oxo-dGTP pyrophosphatase MutT (NUDIX family)
MSQGVAPMADGEVGAWRVLGSRVLHRDHWLGVRTDRCETPDGTAIDAYHVVEVPNWTNVCAVTDDGDLLLVREYRHGVGRVMLGLPGGRVEDAEEADPEAAARRELREETGWGGGDWRLVQHMISSPALQTNEGRSYLAVGVAWMGPQTLDPAERISVERHPFGEVVARVVARELLLAAYDVAAILSAAAVAQLSPEPAMRRLAARMRAACVAR